MQKSNIHYWLALLRSPEVGPITGQKLLHFCPNIMDLFSVPAEQMRAWGLSHQSITWLQNPKWEQLAPEMDWLHQKGHYLVTCQDEIYPSLLKNIPDSPLAFFVKGDPSILSMPQLAIVGSRSPSHAGMDNAFEFAKYLAKAGWGITSGLATGIDSEAHKGALAANGKTIAILGTGIDKTYPASNKALVNKIVDQGGALISEFPLGTPAKAENFPRRNRIVSGLSCGVLVIEATIRSGSLITARLATEQGREVFAIPGSIHNPLARGCHQLIQQGAKLIETAQDILEELGSLKMLTQQNASFSHPRECEDPGILLKAMDSRAHENDGQRYGNPKQESTNLDSDHQELLEYIDYETTPVDLLVERSNWSASDITSMLLILELKGNIQSVPGGYIRL